MALVAFVRSPNDRSPTTAPSTKIAAVTGPHTGTRSSTLPAIRLVPPSGRGTKSRSGSDAAFRLSAHPAIGIDGAQRRYVTTVSAPSPVTVRPRSRLGAIV